MNANKYIYQCCAVSPDDTYVYLRNEVTTQLNAWFIASWLLKVGMLTCISGCTAATNSILQSGSVEVETTNLCWFEIHKGPKGAVCFQLEEKGNFSLLRYCFIDERRKLVIESKGSASISVQQQMMWLREVGWLTVASAWCDSLKEFEV